MGRSNIFSGFSSSGVTMRNKTTGNQLFGDKIVSVYLVKLTIGRSRMDIFCSSETKMENIPNLRDTNL